MSRRKKREIKNTCLIIGEGADDKTFLLFLKSIFYQKQNSYVINIDKANGKSVSHIIEKAIKYKGIKTRYVIKICIIDEDNKGNFNNFLNSQNKDYIDLRASIKEQKLKIRLFIPYCLEGLLYKIKFKSYPPTHASADYVRWFESIIPNHKQSDIKEYERNFTKEEILSTAEENKTLRLLIDVFSGNIFKTSHDNYFKKLKNIPEIF